jgi:hypothetical protein
MKKCIVVLLLLAAAMTSGCSDRDISTSKEESYDKSNYQEDGFHVVEKMPIGKYGSGPIYVVVDKATGYEYFASVVGNSCIIVGAVLGKDGKPVKIK